MPGAARAASRTSSTLAETTGAAVWDVNNALNFPNKHPLCLSMDKASLKHTDLVLGLDLKDWEKQLTELNSTTRSGRVAGRAELRLRRDRLRRGRHQQMGDGLLPHAAVLGARARRHHDRRCRSSPASARSASPRTAALKKRIEDRKVAIGKRHDEVWAKWQQDAKKNWDASPITFQRLAMEVWEVIKNEDWVLTANNLKHEVRKLWDFDKPYRHPGVELGTSTQIGISLGVAMACKEKGRLAVDINPDGDLMFDAGALWIAAKYKIPMLVVMHNNRAYYNDWAHQIRMAKLRGTDEAKAHIGMDLFGPEPDFGAHRARDGLLRRRPDRQARGHPPGARTRARGGEERPAGAGGYDHAAPVSDSEPDWMLDNGVHPDWAATCRLKLSHDQTRRCFWLPSRVLLQVIDAAIDRPPRRMTTSIAARPSRSSSRSVRAGLMTPMRAWSPAISASTFPAIRRSSRATCPARAA